MNVQSSVEEGTLDVPVRDAALLELEQARSFYEKKDTLSSQTRSFFADSVDGNFFASPVLKKSPSWLYYTCTQNDTLLVVDVDLTDCIGQDYILKESWEGYRKYKQLKYRRSYTRYVYTRHLQTGKEQGFFMTIVPSLNCTRNYSTRIEHNTYLHRNKYLSGYVLFHNLDGTFSNGWEYKDGKITGRLLSSVQARLLGLDISKRLHLGRIPASYQVIPKVNKQERIQTRTSGEENWDVDGGWLEGWEVVGGGDSGDGDDWDDWDDPWDDWDDFWGDGDGNDGDTGDTVDIVDPGSGGGGGQSGGYEPDSSQDDNTPPTIDNFISKVVTETLKNNIKKYLNIDFDRVEIVVPNESCNNPRVTAMYKDGQITVYNQIFERNYSRNDMESCLFHEYVHSIQIPAPMDDYDNYIFETYVVKFSEAEIEEAKQEYVFYLEMKGIPSEGDVSPLQEQDRENAWIMFLGDYIEKDGTPKTYEIRTSVEYCENEIEAYTKQLDVYRSQISDKYRKELEKNLDTYKNWYNQIKK